MRKYDEQAKVVLLNRFIIPSIQVQSFNLGSWEDYHPLVVRYHLLKMSTNSKDHSHKCIMPLDNHEYDTVERSKLNSHMMMCCPV